MYIIKENEMYQHYKNEVNKCNTELFDINQAMKDHFYNRMIDHIELVQKFYKKCSKNLIVNHDSLKFQKEELIPYIAVVWNYRCKDSKINFEISDDLRKAMNDATEHHIRENKHHPEYWCKNKYDRDLIAKNERDIFDPNSMPIVDSSSMPEGYLIEMCADWCATAQERGNTPFEWADRVIDKRWYFGKEKTNFIYKTLKLMCN